MINFFERLDKFISNKGLNDNKITVEANISNGIIGKARKRGSLSQENISKILHTYPELNANWLFTGNGAMFIEEKNIPVVQFPSKSLEKLQESQQIPLYDVMATASVVSLFKDPSSLEILDTIHIPNMPTCDGAVAITGDSMYPLIKSGDLVLYKTIEDKRNSVLYGNMYLVGVNIEGDEMLMVKYLHKSENDNYIKLVSENKHHGDVEIHLDNIISLALIKGNVRYNFIK